MTPVVELKGATKDFRGIPAFADVDFLAVGAAGGS